MNLPSLSERFDILRIPAQLAGKVVIQSHYLHRRPPCSNAYGLFENGVIVGCVTYGTPSSAPLRVGICGPEHSHNVMELNRLWVRDDMPKNSESFLIGNTIKRLPKEIIVSYADTEHGHVGYVYQATNWIYTGLSAKRTNWKIDGIDKHSQTIADKMTAAEARAKYGDSFKLVDRSRKHRYVYFNCSTRRKKHLMKALQYPVLPYPKNA